MRLGCVVLTSLFFSLSASAGMAPSVTVKSELASPVILENVQDKNYVKVSLKGFPLDTKRRSPINLALVIDRSSSMSGARIEKARDAAIMAVNMLNSEDTLSVVTYDSTVEVIVPATKVKDKNKLIEVIKKKVQSRGMTALFAGVSKGIEQVSKHLHKEQVNRIILLSDGQANVGPTSINELAELAKIAAKKGIAVTTLGIGEGYNEDLMTAIAGYSDGNHAFVEEPTDLEMIFAKEFNDVMSVVAQDVEVVIQLANNVKPVRLLGRDGEIKGNQARVRLNQLYSNQEKYVLLEVIPAKGVRAETKPFVEINVSYDNLSTKKKDTYQKALAIRYTASVEEVKGAVVEEVLADSAIQSMALENERAVQLMSEGKMSEAQAVLKQSARTLEALPISAPTVKQKIQENVNQNDQLIERMKKGDTGSSRKMLKEQNYNRQQQSTRDSY
ncbi:MAG: VWA domain-containing protein [Cystobacterineae bacterium]|nr:VWA domain-containing protein [Cystobacterineae bacterium]